MSITDKIKEKVKKNNINDFYNLWITYHDYLISLKEKDLILEDYIEILRSFRSACSEVHENICRVVNNIPNDCTNCPIYDTCLQSGKTNTHELYCEIAYAARAKNETVIKQLINEINYDSVDKLKLIEETW